MATKVVSGVLLESAETLGRGDICRTTGLCAEDIIAMAEEGLLDPLGGSPTHGASRRPTSAGCRSPTGCTKTCASISRERPWRLTC
jgi:hypothetical protein